MHRQFCYLPTIFYRLNFFLCWKESQPKFHAKKKTTKWPTKLPIKRNAKGKKGERENKIEIDSRKKSKFWLMRMPEKTKKAASLITSN